MCFLISNSTHVNKKFQQGINSMGSQDDLSNGTSVLNGNPGVLILTAHHGLAQQEIERETERRL